MSIRDEINIDRQIAAAADDYWEYQETEQERYLRECFEDSIADDILEKRRNDGKD